MPSSRSLGLRDQLLRRSSQNMDFIEVNDGLDDTCATHGIDLDYFAPNDSESGSKSPVGYLPRRNFSKDNYKCSSQFYKRIFNSSFISLIFCN